VNQTRPKVRLARALGIPLTPKDVRHFERRPYPPGVHGRRRRNPSDFAIRRREKQRMRHQYNVSEKQLQRAFDEAVRAR
jgi:small subunit ribosomal protein S4